MERPELTVAAEAELDQAVTAVTVRQALRSVLSDSAALRQYVGSSSEDALVSIELGVFVHIPVRLARGVLFSLALENLDSKISH